MKKPLVPVGWREWVRLPDLGGDWVKAKVDTGARSSSLHAFDLEPFERDGEQWLRFAVHPSGKDADEHRWVEAKLLETRAVKSSTGVSEDRPVIRTALAVGSIRRTIDLTLTRRDEMGFRMLLGREALRGAFEVDPGRSFLTGLPPGSGARAPIEIAGRRYAAGEQAQLSLPIARLASGVQVSLPLKVLHGAADGPTMWINAAIHGDEISGVDIIRRVTERLDPATLRGTLLVVPVVNVHGFVRGDRYLPDRRDLNRSFPGSARGSLARRIAHLLLTEVVARCSVGIDLHTGSDGRSNLPQIRADLDDPATAKLARAFGAPIMVHSASREGSLRRAATNVGATTLTFEGGEALRFDRAAIEAGTRGVLRVMAVLGMIDPLEPPRATATRSVSSRWVRAAKSGLAQVDCQLGDTVEKGQLLGRIHDSFGNRISQYKSPVTGIVIGLRLEPLVNRGDALLHVAATLDEDCS
ncbi:MAG: putative deacylase [Myxococcota bacterium]|jgi:predicted deacylase